VYTLITYLIEIGWVISEIKYGDEQTRPLHCVFILCSSFGTLKCTTLTFFFSFFFVCLFVTSLPLFFVSCFFLSFLTSFRPFTYYLFVCSPSYHLYYLLSISAVVPFSRCCRSWLLIGTPRSFTSVVSDKSAIRIRLMDGRNACCFIPGCLQVSLSTRNF